MMLISGQRDRKRHSEAKAIYSRLERFHQETTDSSSKDLYFLEPDAGLHGTQLVDRRVQSRLPVAQNIGVFIERRLLDMNEAFPWRERKSPLGAAD